MYIDERKHKPMPKILLIGTLLSPDDSKFYFDNGIKPAAADIAQKYIIDGLTSSEEVSGIDVIGSSRLKPYPKTKILKAPSNAVPCEKYVFNSVGYLNLPLWAFFEREKRIIHEAKKWAKRNKSEDVVIFVYSMHSPFMKAAIAVKKIIPTAKIVLIVADLPLFMDMSSKLRRVLKQIDWKRIQKLMKHIDKYLLYTKYMAEYLELPDDKWQVFEGLIDSSKIVEEPILKENAEKICIYAGNLDARYGIDMLISAFKKLTIPAKLHIYGAGADAERIKNIVKDCKNIEYRGFVSSEEIFEIMKKADLLINPRPRNIGLAKFSCPSKTFEYMASGTPVVMTALPGLPEEYHEFVYLFEEDTEESFSEKLQEILSFSQSELKEKGRSAAHFLKEHKNSKSQMEKVMDFVYR